AARSINTSSGMTSVVSSCTGAASDAVSDDLAGSRPAGSRDSVSVGCHPAPGRRTHCVGASALGSVLSLGISLVYPDNLAVMADIRLTVDGSPHVAAAGTTVGKVFYELGIEAVVARANGEALRDLAWVPDDGDIVESVPIDTDEGRAVLRHSTAHVLAQAVQRLFPA